SRANPGRRNCFRAHWSGGIDYLRSVEIPASVLRRLPRIAVTNLRGANAHFESLGRPRDIFAQHSDENRSCRAGRWHNPRSWGMAELAVNRRLAQCAAMAAVLRIGA